MAFIFSECGCGTLDVTGATTFNFTGGGVTVTDAGSNEATINIPSPGTGGVTFRGTVNVDDDNTLPATSGQQNPNDVAVGDALQLTVAAISTPPADASTLQYQWQKLGTNGSWANVGANQTTFDVASYAATDAGSYRVKLTTSTGAAEVISATAVVTTA